MAEERLNFGEEIPEEPELPWESAADAADMAETNPRDLAEMAEPQYEISPEDVGENPEEAMPETDMPKAGNKLKWWHIAIPAVLLIGVLLAVFWRPITVHLAPKTVLADALGNTGKALIARNEGTPWMLMAESVDESGQSTTDMAIDFTIGTPFGEQQMNMDLTIQSDVKIRQSCVEATVNVSGESLDINVYVDPDMLALNLGELTGDTYLGIVYDTFGDGIRKNDFLYDNLGEDTVRELEEIVEIIDLALSREPLTDEQIEASLNTYGHVILDFVDRKEAAVSKENVILDGNERSCYAITFQVSEAELGELYEQILDVAEEDPVAQYYYQSYNVTGDLSDWEDYLYDFREDAEELRLKGKGQCEIVFYLYKDQVAVIELNYTNEDENEEDRFVSLSFGENAAQSDIVYSVNIPEGEDGSSGILTLTTEKDDDEVHECLKFVTLDKDGAEDQSVTMGYTWERNDGAYLIYIESEDLELEDGRFELEGKLQGEEDGYALSINEISIPIEDVGGDLKMSLDIVISPGAEIEVPEITDITGLSQADFYDLLS